MAEVEVQNESEMVKIICNDGDTNVELGLLKHMKTLQNLFDDIDDEVKEVSCPVEVSILNTIINFARDNIKDLDNELSRINDLTENQKKYIPEDFDELFKLIKTCNFLDFEYMLEVLSKKIAFTIRNMNSDDYHKIVKEM